MPGSIKPSGPKSRPPERLAELAGRGAVVLDYDGTLAPLRRDPQAVHLSAHMRAVLGALAARRPVAVVSGRELAYLESVTGGMGLVLVGSHGAESGDRRLPSLAPPRVPAALERVVAAAERAGLRVERKPFGRVVHVRELAPALRAPALAHWGEALARALPPGWRLLPGHLVLEARPAAVHKGRVLAPLRAAAGRIAVAVGDDLTDEDLFTRLRPGELGVLVGAARPSAAGHRLAGVGEVRRFVAALARAPER